MKTLSTLKLKPVIEIDLSLGGFISALFCLFSSEKEIVNWPKPNSLSCLSVRSGFHHLLSVLNFPEGTELIMGAITIPDMVEIVKMHGFVPKFVDISQDDFQPNINQINELINDKVKMILVTQLFGQKFDLHKLAKVAADHGIFLVEDCAQAFDGSYEGSPFADATLFSFGPIKKHTCLSGAKVTVKDQKLRTLLQNTLSSLPNHPNIWFMKRLFKYSALKLICKPPFYGMLNIATSLLGVSIDQLLYHWSRCHTGRKLENKLNMQLPTAAQSFLNMRLSSIRSADQKKLYRPWVKTMLFPKPEVMVKKYKRKGIPASSQLGSIRCLAPNGQCSSAESLLKRIVFRRS